MNNLCSLLPFLRKKSVVSPETTKNTISEPITCPYSNEKTLRDNFGICKITDTFCYDIRDYEGCYFKRVEEGI